MPLSLHAKYCDLSLQDRKTHPSLRNWYCFEDSVEVEVAELRKIWAKLIFVVRRSKILGKPPAAKANSLYKGVYIALFRTSDFVSSTSKNFLRVFGRIFT